MNEATIAKKHEEVQVIREKISKAGSTLFVDYLGLTVAEVSDLRVKLHAENCEMKVVKNNILRRATAEEGFAGVEEHLVGPSAIVTSQDEVTAAKIVYGFLKDHEKLSVKAGIIDGKVTNEADLKALSALPNKEGMLSMLLSVLQAPIRNLACVVKAVSEKEN
ncbi:MAG: 50S ribosomal protein L10 [Prevotella sp.]|nr:50S ribosomal protein L10 [Staphylococcus sp.]MCM1350493.1 50S ribosomal protein L10 [Prevotella sp.]